MSSNTINWSDLQRKTQLLGEDTGPSNEKEERRGIRVLPESPLIFIFLKRREKRRTGGDEREGPHLLSRRGRSKKREEEDEDEASSSSAAPASNQQQHLLPHASWCGRRRRRRRHRRHCRNKDTDKKQDPNIHAAKGAADFPRKPCHCPTWLQCVQVVPATRRVK